MPENRTFLNVYLFIYFTIFQFCLTENYTENYAYMISLSLIQTEV